MNVKQIINHIISNKRIMYLSCTIFLLLFCIILNITFSIFTSGANNLSANITVGDLDYKMIINAVELDTSVGTKDRTNTVIGDRIIKLKKGATEQFNISLLSLNDFSTKYEIVFNVCTDVSCNAFIDTPETIQIMNSTYSNDEISGIVTANNIKNFTLITTNTSSEDYFVQIGLNVGYSYNDLALKNQVGTFDPTEGEINGAVKVLAYVNGNPVQSFPEEPTYETTITCTYQDGNMSPARGVFTYNNGWKLNVYDVDNAYTICRVDFVGALQVTYANLIEKYNCANKQTVAENPIITYSSNCSVHQDANGTDWYIKFLDSGTLTVAGMLYVDVFLVGGGAGGSSGGFYNGGAGGGGGARQTFKNIRLSNVDDVNAALSYSITIGAGGGSGAAGGQTKIVLPANTLTANGGAVNGGGSGNSGGNLTSGAAGANGSRAFGDSTTNDTILYGASGGGGAGTYNYQGSGRGAGGTTGGGAGGATRYHDDGYYGDAGSSASFANVGAAGGGGANAHSYNYRAGGSGGSGVLIIRNVRS